MQSKLMDWFLCYRDLRHESVKEDSHSKQVISTLFQVIDILHLTAAKTVSSWIMARPSRTGFGSTLINLKKTEISKHSQNKIM